MAELQQVELVCFVYALGVLLYSIDVRNYRLVVYHQHTTVGLTVNGGINK